MQTEYKIDCGSCGHCDGCEAEAAKDNSEAAKALYRLLIYAIPLGTPNGAVLEAVYNLTANLIARMPDKAARDMAYRELAMDLIARVYE